MAFKAPSFLKKELFIVKCENLKEKQMMKRKKEKLVKVSHTLGHFEWMVIDFASKLNLLIEGLNPHKNLCSFPTFEEVGELCLAKDNRMAKRCKKTNI
jgi:hypothetical protein